MHSCREMSKEKVREKIKRPERDFFKRERGEGGG